jgi:uncharacterized protein (TIGR00730 family)
MELNRICVFCGSSLGAQPEYRQKAREMGQLLAAEKIGIVYGGGNRGLMGELADSALVAGGEVIGVIPGHLEELGVAHSQLTKLHVVETMHARKAMMAELSDAFIALPGGLGTLEELFEAGNWSTLGLHAKPVGLLNVMGYFDAIDRLLSLGIQEQFIHEIHRSIFLIKDDPASLLHALKDYSFVSAHKVKI